MSRSVSYFSKTDLDIRFTEEKKFTRILTNNVPTFKSNCKYSLWLKWKQT